MIERNPAKYIFYYIHTYMYTYKCMCISVYTDMTISIPNILITTILFDWMPVAKYPKLYIVGLQYMY